MISSRFNILRGSIIRLYDSYRCLPHAIPKKLPTNQVRQKSDDMGTMKHRSQKSRYPIKSLYKQEKKIGFNNIDNYNWRLYNSFTDCTELNKLLKTRNTMKNSTVFELHRFFEIMKYLGYGYPLFSILYNKQLQVESEMKSDTIKVIFSSRNIFFIKRIDKSSCGIYNYKCKYGYAIFEYVLRNQSSEISVFKMFGSDHNILLKRYKSYDGIIMNLRKSYKKIIESLFYDNIINLEQINYYFSSPNISEDVLDFMKGVKMDFLYFYSLLQIYEESNKSGIKFEKSVIDSFKKGDTLKKIKIVGLDLVESLFSIPSDMNIITFGSTDDIEVQTNMVGVPTYIMPYWDGFIKCRNVIIIFQISLLSLEEHDKMENDKRGRIKKSIENGMVKELCERIVGQQCKVLIEDDKLVVESEGYQFYFTYISTNINSTTKYKNLSINSDLSLLGIRESVLKDFNRN